MSNTGVGKKRTGSLRKSEEPRIPPASTLQTEMKKCTNRRREMFDIGNRQDTLRKESARL